MFIELIHATSPQTNQKRRDQLHPPVPLHCFDHARTYRCPGGRNSRPCCCARRCRTESTGGRGSIGRAVCRCCRLLSPASATVEDGEEEKEEEKGILLMGWARRSQLRCRDVEWAISDDEDADRASVIGGAARAAPGPVFMINWNGWIRNGASRQPS